MLRVIYNCYPHFTIEELKDKQKCPEAKLESVRFGIISGQSYPRVCALCNYLCQHRIVRAGVWRG